MKKAQSDYSMTELCRIFEINVSSYYYQPKLATAADTALMLLTQSIFVH
jgi:hypothetical protein